MLRFHMLSFPYPVIPGVAKNTLAKQGTPCLPFTGFSWRLRYEL